MLCNYTIHHIKISSLGLMIKHEQFNLNHSTKHIFLQKYIFENTVSGIVKPSVTIPKKSQIIGSLSEPGFHGHFQPQSNQYIIYHKMHQLITQISHGTATTAPFFFQKFVSIRSQGLGPIKRPLTASFYSNIRKTPKMGIKLK